MAIIISYFRWHIAPLGSNIEKRWGEENARKTTLVDEDP